MYTAHLRKSDKTIEISIYKGWLERPNETIYFITNMFVNLFIKWAQLLSKAMVPQEDVSYQNNL